MRYNYFSGQYLLYPFSKGFAELCECVHDCSDDANGHFILFYM